MSRQIPEAVRRQIRGGERAILNSKAEFSNYRIPRLKLEKKEQERIVQVEKEPELELLG